MALSRCLRRGVLNQDLEDVEGFPAKAEKGEKVLQSLVRQLNRPNGRGLYLINSVGFVVVDDSDFTSVRKIQHLRLLDIDDVVNRKGDLDAIAVIMGPEYYSL